MFVFEQLIVGNSCFQLRYTAFKEWHHDGYKLIRKFKKKYVSTSFIADLQEF